MVRDNMDLRERSAASGNGRVPQIDGVRIARAVREILEAIGEDPEREGLRDTPARIARMYAEIFAGLYEDPAQHLAVGFSEGHDEMVILREIPFYSTCEHHLVPFHGMAHVGYVPNGRVTGISKIARVVETIARRPQLQERLTSQIADVIMDTLDPDGVAVVVEAEHLCYDRDTEILTADGWVRFDHLREGVPVAQVDPRTLEMTFVPPVDYVRYRYRGPMLRWRSDTLDLLITPDHRVVMKSEWMFENGGDRCWSVVPACSVPARFYVPQAVRWHAPEVESVCFAGASIGGDDYARFMAVWLAEGCTRESKHDVVISQNCGPFAEMIWALLQRLPFGFRRVTQVNRPNHIQFKSSDRALYEALAPLGKSGEKRIPVAIKQMSARQIDEFLHWYALGDGHVRKKNSFHTHFVSKSYGLIDDIQELLVRTGKTGSVHRYPGCARIDTRAHKRREAKGYKWYSKLQPHHRTIVDFDDEVFCVSVPTGAVLVRRNGKPVVSGNCVTMRGVKKPGAKMVTSAVRGSFKRSAVTRAEFLALVRGGN